MVAKKVVTQTDGWRRRDEAQSRPVGMWTGKGIIAIKKSGPEKRHFPVLTGKWFLLAWTSLHLFSALPWL
jgi:hypothetical protein